MVSGFFSEPASTLRVGLEFERVKLCSEVPVASEELCYLVVEPYGGLQSLLYVGKEAIGVSTFRGVIPAGLPFLS